MRVGHEKLSNSLACNKCLSLLWSGIPTPASCHQPEIQSKTRTVALGSNIREKCHQPKCRLKTRDGRSWVCLGHLYGKSVTNPNPSHLYGTVALGCLSVKHTVKVSPTQIPVIYTGRSLLGPSRIIHRKSVTNLKSTKTYRTVAAGYPLLKGSRVHKTLSPA